MKVELVRKPYGDDLMVVNAARVSFDKESKWERWEVKQNGNRVYDEPVLSDADTRLIQFLARGMTAADFDEFIDEVVRFTGPTTDLMDKEKLIDLLWDWRRNPTHWAPFAHPHATFRIKAPIFVARQLAKHQIGMTWSEVSRRYVDDEPEFYTPEVWRKRAVNVKQGSSDEAVEEDFDDEYRGLLYQARTLYERMLSNGCCAEQARMLLPQAVYTEWIWTGSLYAWANVYNQRTGSHAQKETQEIAKQIGDLLKFYFPVSWEALTGVKMNYVAEERLP